MSDNEEISNNLIDIGSVPQPSHLDDYHRKDHERGTDSPNSGPLSDSELPHIELVDPFASLATSGTDVVSPSNDTGILLNFELLEKSCVTPAFSGTTSCDLINSANQSSKQTCPDLLPQEHSPLKKNRSLDDVNTDDFFANLERTSDTNTLHKPKQPYDPFMKHFHESPRKSNSESNLLVDWGDTINTVTLTPEKPVHHSASSSSISKQATTYDPFAEFGNLNNPISFGPSASNDPCKQPFAPGHSHSARTSPTPLQQQKPAPAPNYNVFISSTGGVFGKSDGRSAAGWGKVL